ncbi:LysR family transcriptional regulator [Rhizobium sp. C4]|uniref:LysR family transcriptional regulator n=1 Tax=Rhizobium sp. C4 TaxID=1349800 RepID=UPI001E2A6BE9|nr:LysR family transcriptional regulator [Rhizobium sp. C4]MCD2171684.1 LysR family transcriptional regulator [Rhizobium sp. C4]
MAEAGWDDLQLFWEVAREGGLSGAAARTGISAPTIGRRMLALERTLGRTLFRRSKSGYELAHDGQVLLERVRAMRAVAEGITTWHQDAFSLPIVAIAADKWVGRLLASQIAEIRGAGDSYRICCNSVSVGFDLTFRSADVAILPECPTSGNLAALRSVTMRYAIYRSAAAAVPAEARWISMGTDAVLAAADRWVFENHEPNIMMWTGDRVLLPELIAASDCQGVLPVHVGDADPRLARQGEVLESLDHSLWIVAHDDDRHRDEVRTVIDRLAAFLKRHKAAFWGA